MMDQVHTQQQQTATIVHSMRNVEDCTGRLNQLSNIFTDDPTSNNANGNYRQDMNALEKLFLKEAKTWWDLSSLRSYIEKNMIPRGLRIKKMPTTLFDDAFMTKWNDILTDSSIRLMQLIVSYEETALVSIRKEIKDIQTSLQQHVGLTEIQEWDTKLKANISKLEMDIVAMKKSKFQRDLNDYKQDCVYAWNKWQRSYTPKSILKSNSKAKKWSRISRKVSFNSSEIEDFDTSLAGSNQELGAAAPINIQPSEHRSASKNEQGGEVGGTGKRYPSRQNKTNMN